MSTLDAVPESVIERARAAAALLAQARAAAAFGAPQVGEHGHEFREVLAPMVLHRSVSPEEWEAISRDGAITGGLNKFNPWDKRREVFFGAEATEKLLHQGGELSRRSEYALMSGGAGKHQAELDAALARIAKVDAAMLEFAEEHGYTSVDELPRSVRFTDDWQRLQAKRQKQRERVVTIQAEARETARRLISTMRAQDEARGYEAVLLTTKPLAGARRYEGKHSGMGEEAEYGMDSGTVKLADIASVRYIKDRKIIDAPVPRVLDDAAAAAIGAEWEAFDGMVDASVVLLDYADSPVLAALTADLIAAIAEHEHATGHARLVLAERVRTLTARIERRQNLQPVKLQNRDRSTAASIAQVQSIGKNPDPDLLGYNKTPTEGAPIVFADYDEIRIPAGLLGRKATVTFTKDMTKAPVQFAVVPAADVMVSHDFNGSPVAGYDALEAPEGKLRAVAGNGRAAGIQLAYAKGTAAGYVAGLLEEADMLQLDPVALAAVEHPMLVRIMRHGDVTADIGDKTNSSGMAGFSAVEQSKTDADRIDFANLSFNEDGTPTLDALTRFVQAMPIAEQAALAPDGSPTNQALDRLMAATFNRAYQNDDLVKLYSQSLDPEIKNVLFGMAQAAGDMAALAGKGEYDIRSFVTDAATMASNAKRAGLPLSRMAEQRDMGMADESNDIAALFARSVRSAKRIGDALRTLARAALAEAESEGEDMFGPVEQRPPAALVAAAVGE